MSKRPSKDRQRYLQLRERGLTQAAAASVVGISRTTAWQWDRADQPVEESAGSAQPLRGSARERAATPGRSGPEPSLREQELAGPDPDALVALSLLEGVPKDLPLPSDGAIVTSPGGAGLPGYLENQRVEPKFPPPNHPMMSARTIVTSERPEGLMVRVQMEGEGLPRRPAEPENALERKRRLATRVSIPLR